MKVTVLSAKRCNSSLRYLFLHVGLALKPNAIPQKELTAALVKKKSKVSLKEKWQTPYLELTTRLSRTYQMSKYKDKCQVWEKKLESPLDQQCPVIL